MICQIALLILYCFLVLDEVWRPWLLAHPASGSTEDVTKGNKQDQCRQDTGRKPTEMAHLQQTQISVQLPSLENVQAASSQDMGQEITRCPFH